MGHGQRPATRLVTREGHVAIAWCHWSRLVAVRHDKSHVCAGGSRTGPCLVGTNRFRWDKQLGTSAAPGVVKPPYGDELPQARDNRRPSSRWFKGRSKASQLIRKDFRQREQSPHPPGEHRTRDKDPHADRRRRADGARASAGAAATAARHRNRGRVRRRSSSPVSHRTARPRACVPRRPDPGDGWLWCDSCAVATAAPHGGLYDRV